MTMREAAITAFKRLGVGSQLSEEKFMSLITEADRECPEALQALASTVPDGQEEFAISGFIYFASLALAGDPKSKELAQESIFSNQERARNQ